MVHIIPLSVGQRRLDTGNAVQYPQGSPIGGAMQGFGDHLSALAERYQQMKDQQDAFDAELARRGFDARIAQAEDEVAANAPADGAGMHEAMYGEVDLRAGRVVKPGLYDTLFDDAKRTMPESQRAAFAGQKENKRVVGAYRMALRQKTKRDDYEKATVDTTLTTNAIAIAKGDPNDTATFEAIRQSGLDLIAKIGNPLARQAAEAAWRTNSAKALVQAMIATDPKRAAEMLGGAAAAGGETAGDSAQAAGNSFVDGPRMAPGKEDRVGTQTPDDRIAQAFRDDLPQEEQDALALKAKVAKFSQDIQTRVEIGRAEREAPDEIARTGAYSGPMPGKDAYRTIYGLDEGDRRRQGLEWRTNVGKKIFDMATMSNQEINAAVVSAEPGPNASPADQAGHDSTAAAANLVLERRRVYPGDYVDGLSSEISEGWKAVFGTGPSDSEAFDQDTYDKTLALSVAQQNALGIADENLQPVPFSFLLKLAEQRDSGSMYFMDNYAKASELFARTKGPVARAALVRELDEAGLGGILPGGKPGLSAIEVFRSEARGLGKAGANAGIFAGKLMKGIGYGASLGTSDPPDFSQGYFEPSNNAEKVMMRQGNDALSWAIPGPGIGRAAVAAKGIPRTLEPLSAMASGRAEGLIAKELPGELSKEGAGLVEGGSGHPAVALDLPSGSFSMSDWADYPIAVVPKPDGLFIRLEGTQQKAARKAADQANRIIRQERGLVGQPVDVHEIKPVKFGGSPTDPSNKVILPREVHQQQVTPWWNKLLKDIGE
ncbi:hypothetical protein NKH34_15020 [Mesorhizobium sp. M1148]|uniref:hypothetical protein n=1 Tax=unclassified Mesorhizobium TaxID=325217 RepID=UPI0003CE9DD9|nr:hypothetical protein [Mesorhizobium sp. LNJC391B00]ESY29440.1 hypothetical protein X749_15970 [Mesorhizobium sp. LNJC391B00]